ncbi:MAG: hemerythrin family protein [Magnetovibrio sp.]|nr:hemerythrin family protein [Magnetovibrio sp.]
MKSIKWNRDLSVGNAAIDEEHKKLISYLNDLYVACHAGQGPSVLRQTLCSLQRYTHEHFSHEEDAMHNMGYPGLADHRAQHGELMDKLDALIEEFDAGADHELSNKTLLFLADWLIQHIEAEDKKIGVFIGASN